MLESHGRGLDGSGVDISRTAGWFTATYPFLLDCLPEIRASFDRAMAALKKIPSGGIGYGVLRYINGHEELDAPVDISFNYLGRLDSPDSMFALTDYPVGDTVSPENRLGYTLEFLISAEGDTLEISISYDSGRVDASDAEQLRVMFIEHLKHAAECRASAFDFSDFGEGGLDAFLDGI
jgi:non-ribosomal peptide synthase protein (TIGR01720 family)